jgi:hypothetical protein
MESNLNNENAIETANETPTYDPLIENPKIKKLCLDGNYYSILNYGCYNTENIVELDFNKFTNTQELYNNVNILNAITEQFKNQTEYELLHPIKLVSYNNDENNKKIVVELEHNDFIKFNQKIAETLKILDCTLSINKTFINKLLNPLYKYILSKLDINLKNETDEHYIYEPSEKVAKELYDSFLKQK